jgi:PKD repeat protein
MSPFMASPTNNWQSNRIQFTATNVDSDGSVITQWSWGFGDNSTGTVQNPTHAYAATGVFFPSLLVTNSLGLVLAVTGPVITVLPPLTLTGVSFLGTNLVLNGANGASGQEYSLLVSTNLTLPWSQWAPLTTSAWSVNGAFSLTVTNALNLSVPQQFYMLQSP